MRIFGGDAAEIVPHADDDLFDPGVGKARKGMAEIEPGALGDTEKGAEAPPQRAAEGGSPIDRQQAESAEESRCPPGFQTMGEPGRINDGFVWAGPLPGG